MGTNKANRKKYLGNLRVNMTHIIKWFSQPLKRSRSWLVSIRRTRNEMNAISRNTPISEEYINENWKATFQKAKNEADKEMKKGNGKESKLKNVSKHDVYLRNYNLDDSPDSKPTPPESEIE